MTRTTFPLEIETLELGHEDRAEGFYRMVVATDEDGTFFDLAELTSDGRQVQATDWRWAMAQEWIAIQALHKFSQLHEAMIKATSPDERALAYADYRRQQARDDALTSREMGRAA